MRVVVKAKVTETIENEVEFEINPGTSEYADYTRLREAGDTAGIKKLLEEGVEVYHTDNRFEANQSEIDVWHMTYEEFEDDDDHTEEEGEAGRGGDPEPDPGD